MRKKYWLLSAIFGLLGAAFLISAAFSVVKDVKQTQSIEATGQGYAITATAALKLGGLYPLKRAEIRFSVFGADGEVLVRETRSTKSKIGSYSLVYFPETPESVPTSVLIEVIEAKFETLPAILGGALMLAAAAGGVLWTLFDPRFRTAADAEAAEDPADGDPAWARAEPKFLSLGDYGSSRSGDPAWARAEPKDEQPPDVLESEK